MSDSTPATDSGGPSIRQLRVMIGALSLVLVLLLLLIGVLLTRQPSQEGPETETAAESPAPDAKSSSLEPGTEAKTAPPAEAPTPGETPPPAEPSPPPKTTPPAKEPPPAEASPPAEAPTPGGAKPPVRGTASPAPTPKKRRTAKELMAMRLEINRRHERDTYVTELENQLINSRSQVTSARARLRDRDAQGALQDVKEAAAILADLPLLAEDFSNYNLQADNLKVLKKLQPRVDAVAVSVYQTQAQAYSSLGTPKALKAARKALESALARVGQRKTLRGTIRAELARVRVSLGDRKLGLAMLKDVLKSDPKHLEAILVLAEVSREGGEVSQSLALLTQAAKLSPKRDLRALRLKGEVLLESKRFEEARQVFARALAAKDDDFQAFLGRGRALLGLGRAKEAQDDLTEAIDILPSLPHGYYHRGLVYLATRNMRGAVKDFEVAISRSKSFLPASLGLGRVLELLGDTERATKELQRAARGDTRTAAEAQARLARLYLSQADPHLCEARGTQAQRATLLTAAKTASREASRAAPTHALALWAKKRLAGEPALVEEYSQEAAWLVKEGQRYRQQAHTSKKPQLLRAAQQAFSLAWVLDPRRADARLEFAELHAEWNLLAPALSAARGAVRVDPRLARAQLLVGQLLGSRLPAAQRKRSAALKALAAALRHASLLRTRLEAHLAVARVQRARDLPAARKALAQAGALIPSDPTRLGPAAPVAQRIVKEWQAVCRELKDAAGEAQAKLAAQRLRGASRQAVASLLNQGRQCIDRLKYKEAIDLFNQVIDLEPDNDAAIYDRGRCSLKLGRFVPGILDFSRSLELNPTIASQVYNKVYQISYVVDLKRVIKEIEVIVDGHPDLAHAVFLRGFFYVAMTESKKTPPTELQGAYVKGILDFDRTLELNPRHVTALNYRALLKTRQADGLQGAGARKKAFDSALADLMQAQTLDPRNTVSSYLQAYLLMHRLKGLPDAEAEALKLGAIECLREAFKFGFKGRQRLAKEPAFAPLRGMPEFKALR
jgi:tetratricopeptide (TPR) repeat protein